MLFLQQKEDLDSAAEGDGEGLPLPRLVQRRSLPYNLSLLCVLLRKKLLESDTSGCETRVVLSREEIIESMKLYMPSDRNEAKTIDQIDSQITKLVEYGFLQPLAGQSDQLEVRRIIKALFDAEWLAKIDLKLKEYQEYGSRTD